MSTFKRIKHTLLLTNKVKKWILFDLSNSHKLNTQFKHQTQSVMCNATSWFHYWSEIFWLLTYFYAHTNTFIQNISD